MPARLLRGAQRKSGRPPSCETPLLRSLERAVTVEILSKYHYLMMNILILGFIELFISLSGLLLVILQFADLSMLSESPACYLPVYSLDLKLLPLARARTHLLPHLPSAVLLWLARNSLLCSAQVVLLRCYRVIIYMLLHKYNMILIARNYKAK